MLMFHTTLLLLALSLTTIAERTTSDAAAHISEKTKRGLVDPDHVVTPDRKFHKLTAYNPVASTAPLSQKDNLSASPYYKNVEPSSQGIPRIAQHHGSSGQIQSYQNIPVHAGHSASYVKIPTFARLSEGNEKSVHASPSFEQNPGLPKNYKILNDAAKTNAPVYKSSGFPYPAEHSALRQNQLPVGVPSFSNFGYSSYPTPGLPQTSGQTGKSPANVQVPLHRANYVSPQVGEFTQNYSPTHQAYASFPSFDASEKRKNEPITVRSNEQISLPVLQLQRIQELPEYLGSYGRQPVVLSSGVDREAATDVGFNFRGSAKPNPIVQSSAPFLSPLSSFQAQVVPIQTSGNAPQFPQYKGASVEIYPGAGASSLKQPTSYEPLQTQPQLHFGSENNAQPVHPNINFRQSTPAEGFLNDVEIIKKEKPVPRKPAHGDGDSKEADDEGYKDVDFERDTQENQGKQFNEAYTENDFKPSKSFPFQQYDELFGKYAKPSQDKEDGDGSHSKHKSYSPLEDDDTYDTSSKLHSGDSAGKLSYENYESGEETGNTESQKENERPVAHTRPDYSFKSEPYKYYEKDFEHEFEGSYRKELPKEKYIHVKEVPEVYEGDGHRYTDGDSEEQRGQGSRVSYNRQKSSSSYKDDDDYDSKPFASRNSKIKHGDGFGYKTVEKKRTFGI